MKMQPFSAVNMHQIPDNFTYLWQKQGQQVCVCVVSDAILKISDKNICQNVAMR
jgi:hypothetical protein